MQSPFKNQDKNLHHLTFCIIKALRLQEVQNGMRNDKSESDDKNSWGSKEETEKEQERKRERERYVRHS